MAKKKGCPIGSVLDPKTKKCVMKDLRVIWKRKAIGDDITTKIIKGPIPVIEISTGHYSRIANGLDDISTTIRDKFIDYQEFPVGFTLEGAVITDGERAMLIDTGGAHYPRHKGMILKYNPK